MQQHSLDRGVSIQSITTSEKRQYEVIVLGAGVSGIYQIKRLVDLGIDSVVLEPDDLGGTWYRKHDPGARFDSESYTCGYLFSKEIPILCPASRFIYNMPRRAPWSQATRSELMEALTRNDPVAIAV